MRKDFCKSLWYNDLQTLKNAKKANVYRMYTKCPKEAMGRFKENYTLYFRLRKNGSKMWYYRTYALDGVRTFGKTTGCESKTKARLFCDELLKKGKLWGGSCKFFRDFATGFFDDNSPWIIDRMSCGTESNPALSKSYINSIRSHLNRYILPFFANYKMEDLRPSLTKMFRSVLLQKGIAPKGVASSPVGAKTINNIVSTFRIITEAALADGVIVLDPLRSIRPLRGDEKPRDAFTLSELQVILKNAKGTPSYIPAIIGACSGMRVSEILAVRPETLHDEYIDVIDQFSLGMFCALKTKEARKIPLHTTLHSLIKDNLDFSVYEKVRYSFDIAIKKSGLSEEKKKRGLCFHSLRHFFNTYLLAQNVPPTKVAAILGHSSGSGSMTERYTNWQPDMFPEIYAAQEKLLKALVSP